MGQFRTEKKAKEHFERMIAEANNAENSRETQQNCRECADWFETVVLLGTPPKMQRVPFSFVYVAICGVCGTPLESDDPECEHCGCKIAWNRI